MTPEDFLIERADELLADRVLQGLTTEEEAELSGLVVDPEAAGLDMELAAAALALAQGESEPMPGSLIQRIESDAAIRFGTRAVPRSPSAIGRVVPWLGWVAAAASLLYAVLTHPTISEPFRPVPEPTLGERLAGIKPISFSRTDHPLARGGAGSLVWSGSLQEGYLTVRGLAETNPRRGVYQLWIFDATRDDRFPIDGGTFTVTDPRATTTIPIRPRLEVREPTLFAVTLEPPGGVVVSDRKRLLLTASLGP